MCRSVCWRHVKLCKLEYTARDEKQSHYLRKRIFVPKDNVDEDEHQVVSMETRELSVAYVT